MLILFLGCGLPICCYCSSTRNTAKTDKTAKTAKTVKTANIAKTSLTDVFDSTPAIIEAIATTELAKWTKETYRLILRSNAALVSLSAWKYFLSNL